MRACDNRPPVGIIYSSHNNCGELVPERPRLLLIGPAPGLLNGAMPEADVQPVSSDPAEVTRTLRDGDFVAVVAAPEVMASFMEQFGRDELILQNIDKGLAILDPNGVVVWANPFFCQYAGQDPVGHTLLESLGTGVMASDDPDPIAVARAGRSSSLRLHRTGNPDQPFLEADIRPALDSTGAVTQLVALVRNVTAEVTQQQKLDALHQAGRELAGLDPEQLAEMNVPSRVELLKINLRKFIHDLLNYDTIEVRLLDRKTGELKPLLEDGMLPEAANRSLYARPQDNGVTGYVAYTGKSYLCVDTANDPHYIAGAAGARSSMTVPLQFHDEVIGTLNVESPRVNGFGPNDLQFTELFSKEIAVALHTLDLLSAQLVCTAAQSIEAVNKEIALPLDEVLAGASVLLEKWHRTDPDATQRLRKILDSARQVKECISRVGRSLTETPLASSGDLPLLGKRVLVVESDERLRRSAHLLMERLGATAESAATGEDGIAMAADADYDAIFQEVKPPDLGGYECYRRLHVARPTAIISLTTGFGYDLAHSIVKARTDGMKYVLFKPWRQEQVVRAVLDGPPPAPNGG
ncbi:MAG: transcriptional regulator [Planctomycetaceae bacterium]|nr:transcriptional regulator [Planctomycetaceae bacterium]